MKTWCNYFETCIRTYHKCSGYRIHIYKEWYDAELATIRTLYPPEEAIKKIDPMKLSWKHKEYKSPPQRRNVGREQ